MTDYSRDEALRIVNVTAMHEGHTYDFDVRNTSGAFLVIMTGHTYPEVNASPAKGLATLLPCPQKI